MHVEGDDAGRLHVSKLGTRTLYASQTPSYPFGLATDATHVYWAEQTEDGDGGSASDGYGVGRILRAPKAGGPAQVMAIDVREVTSIAVENGSLYWGADVGNVCALVRISTGSLCVGSSCAPAEKLAIFPRRIVDVRSVASGAIVVVIDDGRTYRVDSSDATTKQLLTVGASPSVATTNDHLYASSDVIGPIVKRASLTPIPSVTDPYLVLNVSSPDAGVGKLATDCTTLWMARALLNSNPVFSHELAQPGSLTKDFESPAPILQMAADDRHLWLASSTGGVFAAVRKSGVVVNAYGGSVYRLAVDDQGVYFGEHASLDRAGSSCSSSDLHGASRMRVRRGCASPRASGRRAGALERAPASGSTTAGGAHDRLRHLAAGLHAEGSERACALDRSSVRGRRRARASRLLAPRR